MVRVHYKRQRLSWWNLFIFSITTLTADLIQRHRPLQCYHGRTETSESLSFYFYHHWLQTNCQQLTAGVQCKTAQLNFDESWTCCLLCALSSLHRYKHRTDFVLCCQTRKQLTDNSAARSPKNCAVPSPLAIKEHWMNSAYAYYLYKCLLKETNEGAELKTRKLSDGIDKNQTWKINTYWNLIWSNLIWLFFFFSFFLNTILSVSITVVPTCGKKLFLWCGGAHWSLNCMKGSQWHHSMA